ncbi:MAG: hypothetical protein HY298_09040 [Verrucomicrobia bacterium]|nr:hypothetical protein [Verrucomicrobiota bacterium]
MNKETVAFLLLIHCCMWSHVAEGNDAPVHSAALRSITVKEPLSYPPLFVTAAKTLDPMDLARESWKGWVSKRGIPWGMTPELQPTLRLSHECRAFPWPSIKQHGVDGPDNNMRAVGGLALLHAVLGEEFKNEPAEAGIINYQKTP